MKIWKEIGRCLEFGWVIFGVNQSPFQTTVFVTAIYEANKRDQLGGIGEAILTKCIWANKMIGLKTMKNKFDCF